MTSTKTFVETYAQVSLVHRVITLAKRAIFHSHTTQGLRRTLELGPAMHVNHPNIYYLCFPRDSLLCKAAVYALCIYEWVQTAGITADVLVSLTKQADNLLTLGHLAPSSYYTWFSVCAMCGVLSGAVQIFYAWRILKLSGSRICSGLIVLVGIETIMSLQTNISPWMVGAADKRAENITIAACVTMSTPDNGHVLQQLRKMKNGIMETEILINRLICIVVETGSLTAVVSIVTLTLVLGLPTDLLS
ncbi:hypothetical protein IEO21_08133 [Rhodonia placenta]|uniref:Uncharacterized protein n=1 Tax=Rhodonia placenta TaxID=104341 RepID=A0A8H7NX05_9APHY|nr:hypothetical protein IEO21_08133 [Postia placenta]